MLRTLPTKQTTVGLILEIVLVGGILGICWGIFGFWTGLLVGFLLYSAARGLLKYVPFLRRFWYGITRSYPRTFDSAVSCYLLPIFGSNPPFGPPYETLELTERNARSLFDQFRVGTTEQFSSQMMYEIVEKLGEPKLIELPAEYTMDPGIPILAIHILDAPVYRTVNGTGVNLSEARIRYCLYKRTSGGEAPEDHVPEPDIVDVTV